ncbi:stalk domain-containing protein [Calorimonas adulescens]|uniref:Copper amine oxidase N-terminal domain-containing protein n=1 Tax=Calorimonas adulescens TaxID=2606906 RepID=A0A5D8QE30_9THEO|nr:copper amine oxidase N-terminal domain-containing protein [Calorimonas adulescens]TZE82429.1 copper amine oxidase N-terminal domain-containing protein [Calorimonas adulescens]
MKKKLSILVAVLLIVSTLFATAAFAATSGGFKAINAWFGGIKIVANGKTLTSDTQPLMYNNSVYVPIRLVSEALGQKVTWDQNSYSVIISGSTADVDSLKAQIAQKDATIASLQSDNAAKAARIAELEAQLKNQEESKKTASDLEDYLDDEYSTWNRMDFSFDARGDADDLKLTIEIDLSEDGTRWSNTDEGDIEDWLNDIYDYVQDEYPDADFSGEIVDSDSDDTLVEFESSGSKLKVTFNKVADPDDLEYYLDKNLSDDLDWYSSAFGSMKVDFDVTSNKSRERIYITVTVPGEYLDEWESVYDTKGADNWIDDIIDAAYDYFDDNYEIVGEIVDSDGNTLVNFDEDGADW